MEPIAPACRWLLVVEDDVDSREMLQEVLEAEGYAVTSAEGGEGALELLRAAHHPCLVLMDWRMPGMDGSRFLSMLFERDVTLRHRVIVLSGANEAVRARSEPDVVGVLMKPVEVPGLLELVGAHCRRAAPAARLSGASPASSRVP